jgi:GNAT superfamily N-acetyltransferase
MTEAQPKIRRAGLADVIAAYDLMAALGYPNLASDSFASTFADVLKRPDMIVLVAEESMGRVVGLISISHRPQLRLAGTLVSVDELVVAADARGKGIGRALLNEAKHLAEKLGACRIELETNRARESYRRGFYVKNGFIEADSAIMRFERKLAI